MAQRKAAAVSMEHDLAEEAQQRARKLGFTFSAYVVQLIRKDLAHRGSIVVQEDHQMPKPEMPKPTPTQYKAKRK